MGQVLADEFYRQIEAPPGGDERIAAFSRAAFAICTGTIALPPEFITELNRTDAYHPTASYAANIALRALQKQFMTHESDYPAAFIEPGRWTAAMHELAGDPDRIKTLRADLQRAALSNVVERYKAPKLVLDLLSDRVGPAPRILDVGCSRNHGLKKLHLNLPFQSPELDPEALHGSGHDLLERLVAGIVKKPQAFGPSTGADKVSYDDPQDIAWARSCSFYPGELLNELAVDEYDYLDAVHPEGIRFTQLDFTGNLNEAELQTDEFDVIIASTFMYQLSREERRQVHGNFRRLVKFEGGVIIYQDFARPSDDKTELDIAEHWFDTPYTYKTMVELSGSNDQPHIYDCIRWSNGRCGMWRPGADIRQVLDRH